MTNTNIIIHNLISFVHKSHRGSSFLSPALGWAGQGRLNQNTAPPPEFLVQPKRAGKKEGGWGEGIFARLLTAPKARLRWERLRSLAPSREAKQDIFQFLLEEKGSRAKIEKREKGFALHRRQAGGATGRVQFFRSKKVRISSNKRTKI